MPKNIVILSDGTGQEGGEGNNTNIYKIFNMIEDRTPRQIAYYDSGLGTGRLKVTGKAGGMGISRNIRECYRFLFDHYESGDSIFLFGFSRGAATVRSLASFIHYFGILPKSRPELIKKAYRLYRHTYAADLDKESKAFVKKHHTMWTRIKFVGCFDTVAALGLPWKFAGTILNAVPGLKHKFHEYDLSLSVEHACHALAIDDRRKTFHPALWRKLLDPSYQSVRQVWFCGMHTDVGGGYAEQELSDIPLVWMTSQAVAQGLHIHKNHGTEINENADGYMHNSRKSGLAKLYREQERAWVPPQQADKPILHESVLARKKDTMNHAATDCGSWILGIDHEVEPWVRYEAQPWHHDKF